MTNDAPATVGIMDDDCRPPRRATPADTTEAIGAPPLASDHTGAALRVGGLHKRLSRGREAQHVLQGVSFDVAAGEFYSLLGPSGCGKTTALRCLAGLERPDAGRIELGGDTLVDTERGTFLAPQRRNLGMVFQSYAIWPHMTVLEHVKFPLGGRRRTNKTVTDRDCLDLLERVGLAAQAFRSAALLSGGQQQRLSIARALITHPRLLLLDEPMSNLDARVRARTRAEIKRLQTEFGVTTVYVTHDQSEAMALSDRIGVMTDGQIVEDGTPHELYAAPRTHFAASFIGASWRLDGTLAARHGSAVQVDTELGPIHGIGVDDVTTGNVSIFMRPQDFRIIDADAATPTANTLTGTVAMALFLGESYEYTVDCAGHRLAVNLPTSSLVIGDRITVAIEPTACRVFRTPAK